MFGVQIVFQLVGCTDLCKCVVAIRRMRTKATLSSRSESEPF